MIRSGYLHIVCGVFVVLVLFFPVLGPALTIAVGSVAFHMIAAALDAIFDILIMAADRLLDWVRRMRA